MDDWSKNNSFEVECPMIGHNPGREYPGPPKAAQPGRQPLRKQPSIIIGDPDAGTRGACEPGSQADTY